MWFILLRIKPVNQVPQIPPITSVHIIFTSKTTTFTMRAKNKSNPRKALWVVVLGVSPPGDQPRISWLWFPFFLWEVWGLGWRICLSIKAISITLFLNVGTNLAYTSRKQKRSMILCHKPLINNCFEFLRLDLNQLPSD